MIRAFLAATTLALAAIPSIASACTVEVKRDIAFGTGPIAGGKMALTMDVYQSVDCGTKIHPVQLIHGGGFKSGKKEDDDLVRIAMSLVPRGYTVFLPNYRLSPSRPVLETVTPQRAAEVVDETGYPEAYYAMVAAEDAAKMRNYVADHASQFGVTRKRWTVGGTSAGAIAALFTGYAGDDYFGKRWYVGAVLDLWGMVPAEVVKAGEPPVLIVSGTADRLVPYRYSVELYERAKAVGVDAEFISMPGAGHEDGQRVIYTQPYRGGVIADRIGAFLDEHIKRPPVFADDVD